MAAAPQPAPTRYGGRDVYSVAGFLHGTAGYLERLPRIWVEGEVGELRRQSRWKLVFFSLRDLGGTATVPVCMPRYAYDRLPAPLADGDRVHVQGRAQLRRDTGSFSLYADAIEPYGLGTLLRDHELLRRRLAAEGLFAAERKRPLPRFPRVVGLICGRNAAARQDVERNAALRYPPVRFRVLEAPVQGPAAPAALAAALRALDADTQVDVIVLARGGGSFEDLAAFSDERLCRAIAACGTPVVSAIGHEQDTPLSDLVADLRASTPTDAAKRIVPDAAVLLAETGALAERARRIVERRLARERERLDVVAAHPLLRRREGFVERRIASLAGARGRLDLALDRRLAAERTALEALRDRPALRRPELLVEQRRGGLDEAGRRLRAAAVGRVREETAALEVRAARLQALGPGATLERGYAIVQDERGHVVTDAAALAPGRQAAVRLARGRLRVRIEEAER